MSDSSASKSVKSLSALSKTSWLQSSKAKKVKKRSLNALFDMIGARKAVLNRFVLTRHNVLDAPGGCIP